jgi:hypothetical protein
MWVHAHRQDRIPNIPFSRRGIVPVVLQLGEMAYFVSPGMERSMSSLSAEDWKTFLEARIQQENGADEQALKVFEALLAAHPDDRHLQASRAFALERLGRAEEAVADRISAKYTELGRTLVGSKDKPDVWTEQLQSLVGDIDQASTNKIAAAALMAW